MDEKLEQDWEFTELESAMIDASIAEKMAKRKKGGIKEDWMIIAELWLERVKMKQFRRFRRTKQKRLEAQRRAKEREQNG